MIPFSRTRLPCDRSFIISERLNPHENRHRIVVLNTFLQSEYPEKGPSLGGLTRLFPQSETSMTRSPPPSFSYNHPSAPVLLKNSVEA